ncbi:actin-domain-containing protein [Exidia glandulosa HHB12029]|uniref:Actin-domain-containing protein n=1 Tax=Exidia glandulosa HHB12029 TaxID=1314781 RepID=A0A166A8K8_EXIGL|nr:actin-domain-containing protein [Exidia glandulosa HHB12029]
MAQPCMQPPRTLQFVKVGFAGSNFPEHKERVSGTSAQGHQEPTVGDAEFSNFPQDSQPVEHDIIKNWDDTKHPWDYTSRKILLTEPPMNPKMAQVIFEEYGFGGVYVAIETVLTLYIQVRYCVDSGDDVTHIVPSRL